MLLSAPGNRTKPVWWHQLLKFDFDGFGRLIKVGSSCFLIKVVPRRVRVEEDALRSRIHDLFKTYKAEILLVLLRADRLEVARTIV